MSEERQEPAAEQHNTNGPPPQPKNDQPPAPTPPLATPAMPSPPVAKPASAARDAKDTKAAPHAEHNNTREIIETVVFVAVLVLLLKTFVAEAFVIPTGSMATTLLGYHKKVSCEQCGYPFLVNASSEGDVKHDLQPLREPPRVIGGFCPNCRYYNDLYSPEFREGPLP